MEANNNDYHISFFKPTTQRSKLNRNIVLLLVSIWAVAVFGFQIWLKVIENPTPEPSYFIFEKVWDNVKSDKASDNELQEFAYASLSVLGKIAIKDEHKEVLNNALSWSVYQLLEEDQKGIIFEDVKNFEKLKDESIEIADKEYFEAKNNLTKKISPILGLQANDARINILPFGLLSSQMKSFQEKNKEEMPLIMETYLIHNQSYLTDTKFLGFPFHYFYSSIFLLILFVFLCWLYCVQTDKMNEKLKAEN